MEETLGDFAGLLEGWKKARGFFPHFNFLTVYWLGVYASELCSRGCAWEEGSWPLEIWIRNGRKLRRMAASLPVNRQRGAATRQAPTEPSLSVLEGREGANPHLGRFPFRPTV
jgi:hypothetical protein